MGKSLLALMLLVLGPYAHAVKYGNSVRQSSSNYPNLVEFTFKNSICSGTRISKNYALTAAHCFREVRKSFKVQYYNGSSFITETIHPSEVIINSTRLDRELALVPLNPRYGSSDEFRAYPLYHYEAGEFAVGDKFEIAGFGINQRGIPESLRIGTVKYHGTRARENRFDMLVFAPLEYRELAAGESSRQLACPGDSGGPIFHLGENGEKSLLGVVSYISSTTHSNLTNKSDEYQCKKADRSYYIPVSLHLDFLSANGITL